MPRQHHRAGRLFLDADGRLSDLLTRLNIKTSKVKPGRDPVVGRLKGLALVVTNATTVEKAIRALEGRSSAPAKAPPKRLNGAPSRNGTRGNKRGSVGRAVRRPAEVSASLLAHAIETFGSEETARSWLSSECGALNNRTPLQVIGKSGDEAEVERLLSCIDYGMIA